MTDDPEEVFPTEDERDVGRAGIETVRQTLANAFPPHARPVVPLPKPRPIDPSEPREREEII